MLCFGVGFFLSTSVSRDIQKCSLFSYGAWWKGGESTEEESIKLQEIFSKN